MASSIIGLAGSLIGGDPVKNAADQAGQNEYTAGNNAQNAINTTLANTNTAVPAATTSANNTLQGFLNGLNTNTAPGVASGVQGNTSLQQYAASNPTFTAPTAAQAAASPGEQFALSQGTEAIQNNAAAQGLSQGGGTLAALTQYGQGLASTYYQNAFNNAQSQFQTNQNTTLANLSTLIGAGNTANTQQLGAATTLGAPQAANTVNQADYLGSLNLQGQTTSGEEGIQTATTAGNFGVEGAGAQQAYTDGITGDVGGTVSQLPNIAGQINGTAPGPIDTILQGLGL